MFYFRGEKKTVLPSVYFRSVTELTVLIASTSNSQKNIMLKSMNSLKDKHFGSLLLSPLPLLKILFLPNRNILSLHTSACRLQSPWAMGTPATHIAIVNFSITY